MFLMKIKTSCSMLEFISTSSVDSLFNVQEAYAKWTWKVYGSLLCSLEARVYEDRTRSGSI